MGLWVIRVAYSMLFFDPTAPWGMHWPVILLGTIITIKDKILDLVGFKKASQKE